MTVNLGSIILAGVLGVCCCFCGIKQAINHMDRPTFVDAEYWRNRQARQVGDMQNTHWIQPPTAGAASVRATSHRAPFRVASCHSAGVQSVPGAYMAARSVNGARTFRSF